MSIVDKSYYAHILIQLNQPLCTKKTDNITSQQPQRMFIQPTYVFVLRLILENSGGDRVYP